MTAIVVVTRTQEVRILWYILPCIPGAKVVAAVDIRLPLVYTRLAMPGIDN